MGYKKPLTCIISIVTLFLVVALFPINSAYGYHITAEINTPTDWEFSEKTSTKQIFMYNWTGCYDLNATAFAEEFSVFCHIPIVVEGQAPIITDVWTVPDGKVIDFRIHTKDYSGTNCMLEVRVSSMNPGETVKLFFSTFDLMICNDYPGLPSTIPKTSVEELPENVALWLASTDFIQANHPDIIGNATQLAGSETNVLTIANRIANFTGNVIEYIGGGRQDALTTLHNGYAVCTGKATLAVALFRALDIPARVLMVYPTHFIMEFYAHPYGWIWIESSGGTSPFINQWYSVAFCAYPEHETDSITINGQSPYRGVIAFWGTSTPNVYQTVDYTEWYLESWYVTTTTSTVDESLNITTKVWNSFAHHLGGNLTSTQEVYFNNALTYQRAAIESFESKQLLNYIDNMNLAYDEYLKIKPASTSTTVPTGFSFGFTSIGIGITLVVLRKRKKV